MKFATLLSALVLSTSAAFAAATTTTANTIGVLRVDSTANRTIVAVPWAAAGIEAGNIRVTDLVKTANLTVNDTLSYYDSATGKFSNWTLVSGGEGNPPVWQAATEVSQSGSGEKGVSSDVQTLPRGGALILVRQTATSPFYLQGQVPASGTVEQTLPNTGTVAAPVYSLIAPPTAQTDDIALSSATWTNVGAKDQLVIQGVGGQNTVCEWKDGAWKVGGWAVNEKSGLKEPTWTAAPSIKPGTGFWYVSRTTGENAPQVKW